MPMSTELQRTCPSCGNELSGAMEFCPICMLRKGLAGAVESGESSSEDTLMPDTILMGNFSERTPRRANLDEFA
jgi:hypothetical protein